MKKQLIILICTLLISSSIFAQIKIWNSDKKLSKSDLQKKLSSLQYRVTQEDGTETPFKNKYWNNKKQGIYVDIVSGEPLFSSLDKYKSGTGWPSFTKPLEKQQIIEKKDRSLFSTRTEIRSKLGNSHLGHVFSDGPKPTGLRYCMNSASLKFVALADLDKQGYGKYKKLFKAKKDNKVKEAYLAGGCFWGMEKYLRRLPGVIETEVGYIGGSTKDPKYTDITTGTTGHAEAVRVSYDESKLTYQALIRYFFRIHDPSTLNQQGNDKGTQYRSTVFTNSADEKSIIKELIIKIDNSKVYAGKVATSIEPQNTFTEAETHHQDYLEKNPNGYDCHLIRPDFPF